LRDWDSTYKEAIVELFHRGGLEFTEYEQCLEWAKANGDEWYRSKTWTEKEEKDFIDWLIKLMNKQHPCYTIIRDKSEAFFFILDYGWKTV